jgi:hypothetical protein
VTLGAALVCAAGAAAVAPGYRYERPLVASGSGPFQFEPDARLTAHTRDGFADLRVVDAHGRQVPWRLAPPAEVQPAAPEAVDLLNVGKANGEIVALIDLGPARTVRSELELIVPGKSFVGRVTVLGGDDRSNLRRLSEVAVWDIQGARHSRSTTVTFPPSDLRYLELHGRDIPGILGATVAGGAAAPHAELLRWPVRSVSAASADGRSFFPVAGARLFSYPGASNGPLELGVRARYLRLRIWNGDDRPLGAISLVVEHEPTPLLVRADGDGPYTLHYGAARSAPDYDFARLPASALGLPHAATLGPERLATPPKPPHAKATPPSYHWLVILGLVLAALVVAGVGVVVLRGKTPT